MTSLLLSTITPGRIITNGDYFKESTFLANRVATKRGAAYQIVLASKKWFSWKPFTSGELLPMIEKPNWTSRELQEALDLLHLDKCLTLKDEHYSITDRFLAMLVNYFTEIPGTEEPLEKLREHVGKFNNLLQEKGNEGLSSWWQSIYAMGKNLHKFLEGYGFNSHND